jgi:hypothetical protein
LSPIGGWVRIFPTYNLCNKRPTPHTLTTPTHQEETNQKLSTSLISLQAQVNKDILAIHAKMELSQEQFGSQIVEVHSALHHFMNTFQGPSSSDPPLYTKVVESNQPLHSYYNSLPHDPHLPRVEVNKFDGSGPQSWVTQMEHDFSLHGIIDELTKLHYGIIYLDLVRWKWWQWHRNARQWYVVWSQFVAELYECLRYGHPPFWTYNQVETI